MKNILKWLAASLVILTSVALPTSIALGALSQYGLPGIYNASNFTLSDGTGSSMATDINGRMIISPSSVLSTLNITTATIGTAIVNTLASSTNMTVFGTLGINTTTADSNLSIVSNGANGSNILRVSSSTNNYLLMTSEDTSGIVSTTFSAPVNAYVDVQGSLVSGEMIMMDDGGLMDAMDMGVSNAPATTSTQGYTFNVDSLPILSVTALPDGLGSVTSSRVGIGTTTPQSVLTLQIQPNSLDNPFGIYNSVGTNLLLVSNTGFLSLGTKNGNALITANLNASTTLNLAVTDTSTIFQMIGKDGQNARIENDVFGGFSSFMGRRANGTVAAPTALTADNIINRVDARGYGATTYSTSPRAMMDLNAWNTWTDASQPTYIAWSVTPSSSITTAEQMRLDQNGRLGIGTTTPKGILHVASTLNTTTMWVGDLSHRGVICLGDSDGAGGTCISGNNGVLTGFATSTY